MKEPVLKGLCLEFSNGMDLASSRPANQVMPLQNLMKNDAIEESTQAHPEGNPGEVQWARRLFCFWSFRVQKLMRRTGQNKSAPLGGNLRAGR